MPIEYLITAAASLLLLSVLTSKASEKLGVPALLLFLAVGMLAGSDGPGGIEFDTPRMAQSLGVVALALILFAGGLSTNWADVRPVLWHSLALSTAGVFATAVLVGLPPPYLVSLSSRGRCKARSCRRRMPRRCFPFCNPGTSA